MKTITRVAAALMVLALVGCAQEMMPDPGELEGKAEYTAMPSSSVWFDEQSDSTIVAEAILRGGLPGPCKFFDLMPDIPQMVRLNSRGNSIGILIDDFYIRMAPGGIPEGKSVTDLTDRDYERIIFLKENLRGCTPDIETQTLTCTYYAWAALEDITKVIKIDMLTRTVTSFELIEDLATNPPKTIIKCVGD